MVLCPCSSEEAVSRALQAQAQLQEMANAAGDLSRPSFGEDERAGAGGMGEG